MVKFNKLGGLVREFRTRARMSQSTLARLAGIHSSHLNRIESGERPNPRRKTIEALARSLFLSRREADELIRTAGYVSRNTDLPAGTFGAPPLRALQKSEGAIDIGNRDTPEKTARHILSLLSTDNIPEHEKEILARQIRSFADWIVAESQKNLHTTPDRNVTNDGKGK